VEDSGMRSHFFYVNLIAVFVKHVLDLQQSRHYSVPQAAQHGTQRGAFLPQKPTFNFLRTKVLMGETCDMLR
jgi:hypothetical protein